jgi:hypothetical protein
MNTILSGLNKTKYVPPSQRNSIMPNRTETAKWAEIPKRVETQKWTEIPKRVIQKKVPEFSLTDTSLFPTLESSVNKNKTSKPTIMSFAAAAKYEEPKKEEKISEYNPGWVYIRQNNGVIEYKYEPQLQKIMMEQLQNQLKCEESRDLRNLNSRIARLQWDQDRENNRLGDLSMFHNAISIKDQLDEAYINNDDEITHSYISDNYVNNLSDSENNVSLPENK